MQRRITKRSVDAAKPAAKRYYLWDTDLTGFGLMVTPAGKKSYVLQYRRPGVGRRGNARRITLGAHGALTPDQARKLAADELLAVKSGADPAVARRGSDGASVADLVERFLTEFLPNKKKPPRQTTIKDYRYHLESKVIPALGSMPVKAVTMKDIERLHASMRSTPYAANRVLAVLRHAFDQAEAWGWRPQYSNPARHIERYREERRGGRKEVMLSAEQMKDLLEAIDVEEAEGADPGACAALRLAFWTGWRISEVLRLEWKNVDLDRGAARLLLTKTADEEHRQLASEALAVLRGLEPVAGCPYVFPGRDLRGHLTTVKGPWLRIRKRASLDDLEGLGALRLHDLRHNVVSWDVSRGVPLEIAGKNVGHRSRQATEVYAHFAPDALRRAAEERAEAMRSAVENVSK